MFCDLVSRNWIFPNLPLTHFLQLLSVSQDVPVWGCYNIYIYIIRRPWGNMHSCAIMSMLCTQSHPLRATNWVCCAVMTLLNFKYFFLLNLSIFLILHYILFHVRLHKSRDYSAIIYRAITLRFAYYLVGPNKTRIIP